MQREVPLGVVQHAKIMKMVRSLNSSTAMQAVVVDGKMQKVTDLTDEDLMGYYGSVRERTKQEIDGLDKLGDGLKNGTVDAGWAESMRSAHKALRGYERMLQAEMVSRGMMVEVD